MLSTVLIIEDDRLFYPKFLRQLSADGRLDLRALVIAKPKRKHNRLINGLKQVRCFRLKELIKLVFLLAVGYRRGNSLRAWAKQYDVPCMVAAGSANTPEIVAFVQAANAQFLLSASPLILKEELLAACPHPLNMHFSLLPAYKGIMPLFQAFAHGEAESGISLHRMVRKVDEGEIILQRRLPLDYSKSLMQNYTRFFDAATQMVGDAFQNIEAKQPPEIVTHAQVEGYFSHPTEADWKKFRAAGVAFV